MAAACVYQGRVPFEMEKINGRIFTLGEIAPADLVDLARDLEMLARNPLHDPSLPMD
jgi:hypothetical protein